MIPDLNHTWNVRICYWKRSRRNLNLKYRRAKIPSQRLNSWFKSSPIKMPQKGNSCSILRWEPRTGGWEEEAHHCTVFRTRSFQAHLSWDELLISIISSKHSSWPRDWSRRCVDSTVFHTPTGVSFHRLIPLPQPKRKHFSFPRAHPEIKRRNINFQNE